MSAILAVADPARPLPSAPVLERMLGRMARRGAAWRSIERLDGAALGVSRFAWEREPGFSGAALVVREGDLAVAADATLYYTGDLRRRLADARVAVAGDTPSHLLLAAYRAWGERCAEHLEGDFAFVIHDGARRRVLAARDFSGKRPLFVARVDSALVVASGVAAVLDHPGCPQALDLPAIASLAACLWAEGPDTAYQAVKIVPAGHTLVWDGTGEPRLTRHWRVPEVEARDVPPFEEAAEELRRLLARAAAERLAPSGPTAVWMSGGWDSSAVFASARQAAGDAAGAVRPVSISYPRGDPGREDELIEAIAAHAGADVHWLDIARIPMFVDPAREAAARDEPMAHMYEHWNRALAEGARETGARVALDGNGGDQFFQVSPSYFADLLRAGRLRELRRDARVRGIRSARELAKWSLFPALPEWAFAAMGVLRGGRAPRGPFDRPLPAWFDGAAVPAAQLAERERATRSRPPRALSCAGREVHFFLTCTAFPRAFATLTELAGEHGVELRSPLYDGRVIAFAAARPREERATGGETKRLLRRAMRGLLPDAVLAPRRTRTGMTTGYSDRSLRAAAPLFDEAFRAPLAAELGIVKADALRAAWTQYRRTGRTAVRAPLFMTLQLELWLRARLRGGAATPRLVTPEEVLATAS